MATLWNKNYSKNDICQYAGSISQIAGAKMYELKDGKAFGVRGIDVKTGSGLEFTVLPDRGMDISWASFKGKPLSLITKNGIVGSKYYESRGDNWFRSYFGGLLTTCGLSNTGASCDVEGVHYGLHGRISNTPAERVAIEEEWQGDEYHISVKGNVRESSFYDENLLLTRKITTKLGGKSFAIHDTVENQGYSPVPAMLLYHINIGFPLLDENTRLLINTSATDFFDEAAEMGKDAMTVFQKPTHEYFRQVFLHTLKEDSEGNTLCAVINEKLDQDIQGLYIRFNRRQLPEFFEFKMMGQSDYQLGLEPSNCLPMGRAVEKERNGLPFLEGQESKDFTIEMGIIESQNEYNSIKTEIENLK